MKDKKIILPGIGMRIIKSGLAVSLCVLVNILRGEDGIVFYSQLAALWCIQMYRDKTISNAIQRTIGTVVGALFGLLYLLEYPRAVSFFGESLFLEAAMLFIFIVMVIYSTVVIHKNQSSYFSCVVFLSIVINHIGDKNPYFFVWNRFLDTMIGIAIGILVNDMRICFRPDKKTLFVSGVDDILVDGKNKVSAFSKVELNRMIDSGLKFTLATKRTPASLLEPLSDVHFKYPVIVMDGAALYDVKKSEYKKKYIISAESATELYELCHLKGFHPYVNVIIDDTLLIYYEDCDDPVNNMLVESLRTSPFRNYIKRPFPGDENVVYFMLLDISEKIQGFYEKLKEQGYDSRYKILCYPSDDYPGYSYIKIYSKNATKENMLSYLKDTYGFEKTVTMGTIEGKYDILLKGDNFDEMVKQVRKRYEKL